MLRKLFLLTFLASLSMLCACQRQSIGKSDMKFLIIYGDNFYFSVSEPDGWTVNIDDARTKHLNAYFTIDGHDYDNTPGLIYIRVMNKQGLSIDQHLQADMDDFKGSSGFSVGKLVVFDERGEYF